MAPPGGARSPAAHTLYGTKNAKRRQRSQVRVDVVTDHTAEVRGTGAFRVLERLSCPKQFQYRPPSFGSPCWTIPASCAPDVEAMAERLGVAVVLDAQAVIFG